MMADSLQETLINGRWTLYLPEHRATRREWAPWTNPDGRTFLGWEYERLNSMYNNIGPGDVVYDIGTEEGDISALMQTWIGTGDGGVCLFEPNERVWPNVKAIWEGNYLKTPLACWSGFAGDFTRATNFAIDEWPASADGPLIGDHGFCNLSERDDIPCIKLDDFIDILGTPPTVITMDVEGSELNVLMGARDILRQHMPLVYISVHPEFMKDMYNVEAQQLHELMGAYGYRCKHLATDHEQHWVYWHPYGRELRF